MNLLIDELPNEIDGVPIRTNFSAMVLFELMLADSSIPNENKIALALNCLYKKPVSDLKKAVDGLLWYYSCGHPPKESESEFSGETSLKRAYDFEVDAPMIYAAFVQTYAIDLNNANLHWWKFCALFQALPEDCRISKIMGYRTMDCSKLKGEEKKFYEEQQSKYQLAPLGIEKLSLTAAEKMAKDRVKARFAEAEKWKRGEI